MTHYARSQYYSIVLGASDIFEMFHYAGNHPGLIMIEANDIEMCHRIRSQPTLTMLHYAAAETQWSNLSNMNA